MSRSVVSDLVEAGLLDPANAAEADPLVARALGCAHSHGPASPRAGSMRRRMSEVAGYVGGAFVVGAAILFFTETWTDLSLALQIGLLMVTALVLFAAGGAMVATAGGPGAVRAPAEAVRRRLASVLFTGAAGSAAFAVGVLLDDVLDSQELGVMLAALIGLAVALVGYLMAPSTVGQLGAAVAAFVSVPAGLESLPNDSSSLVPFGLLVLSVGVVWLVAAERGLWQELRSAQVIALVLALVGAQIPVLDERSWVGYLLTGLVGVAAFGLYLSTQAWPYLAAGVVGVTVAVPEAVDDLAEGLLGAAGMLLVTGMTLLFAALFGLRLRQEVTDEELP
ncbi:hypothetical protein BH18ACT9_BH18ACT9_00010 [soil metagenome]